MKRILILAATAGALACGSSSNNAATSRNNPGAGSSTLKVTGDITAALAGATPAPQTIFSVTVKDGSNANVSGATVTVLNGSVPDGVVNLTETPAGSGTYRATVASFPSGDFQLNVVKGTDIVQGVVVGGPGMHTISAPASGASITHGTDLALSWTTPIVAKQVSVSTRDMGPVSGADLGAFTIPAAQNPLRAGQILTIIRSNEVAPAGGLGGSILRATYTATVAYAVQ